MLLTIDIGNTNVVAGVYDGSNIVTVWRMATDRARMPDEWWALLSSLASADQFDLRQLGGAIIASGVPRLTTTFQEMIARRMQRDPIIVNGQLDLGIRVLTDHPGEVGPDRLVNAIAAHWRYGGPAIVVDFGTATTFDVISTDGDYLGGAIAPGIVVALEALTSRAARLTAVELTLPPQAIGKNTIHSMQSGTVLGYVGLIEGLVRRISAELPAPPTVIATGGLGRIFTDHTDSIDHFEPNITLDGLRLLYDRLVTVEARPAAPR